MRNNNAHRITTPAAVEGQKEREAREAGEKETFFETLLQIGCHLPQNGATICFA